MQARNARTTVGFTGLPVVGGTTVPVAPETLPDPGSAEAQRERIRAQLIAEKIVAYASPDTLIDALAQIRDRRARHSRG